MKFKTSELTGAELNWAVAQCEGRTNENWMLHSRTSSYSPSKYWTLGGPIIERENISTRQLGDDNWRGSVNGFEKDGPTQLIAAMRCYVASKLGDEVEVTDKWLH